MMSNITDISSEFFEVVTSIVWDDYTAIIDDSSMFNDKLDSNHSFQTPMFLPRIIIGSILALFTLLTMINNALVLIAFFTRRHLRGYFNFFIIGITIADSVMGFFSMPFMCLEVLYGYWPFGRNMCIVFIIVGGVCLYVSILAVVIISLDRYLSLAKPLKHYGRRSSGRALKLISFAYAIPVIVWLGCLHWMIIVLRQIPEGSCSQNFVFPSWMSLSMTLIVYWIPCFLIVVFNLKTFCLITRQRRRISAQLNSVNQQGDSTNSKATSRSKPELVVSVRSKRKWRSLRTLCLLVVVFLICWTPYIVLTIGRTFCFSCFPSGIFEVSTFKGVLHPNQKLTFFCSLSPNSLHRFEK